MIKIDLHVHSIGSNQPAGFFSEKFGLAESYTSPLYLYKILKQRGKTLVTITDHDSIDGCLEIAHLPDTFISEEVSAYFPEDKTLIHVLTFDINEVQHKEIQKLRYNIYELVDYLQEQDILYSIAHPLYDMTGTLCKAHLEKMLLLFDIWEIQNGSRSRLGSEVIKKFIDNHPWNKILQLADKYGFLKRQRQKISFTAGTDDHAGLDAGKTYTLVKKGHTLEDLKKALRSQKTIPQGIYGSPVRLGHNIMKIIYTGVSNNYNLGQFQDILDRIFKNGDEPPKSIFSKMANAPLAIIKRKKTDKLLKDVLDLDIEILNSNFVYYKSYYFVNYLIPQAIKKIINGEISLQNISSYLGLSALSLLPLATYTSVYYHRAHEKEFARKISQELNGTNLNTGKTICFTDTFFDINGVAKTYQNIWHLVQKHSLNFKLALCKEEPNVNLRKNPYLKIFKPALSFPLPEYPEITVNMPSFLKVLNYVEKENFEVVYAATPGILGITALLVAKILKLPFVTTFHTDFAAYVYKFTNDFMAREITWNLLSWFYNRATRVLVPSNHCKEVLIQHGVRPRLIETFQRGVNLKKFNPAYKNKNFFKRFIPNYKNEPIILYVGRVSKEKEIDVFLKVANLFQDKPVHFVIVGDGPYRKEAQNQAPQVIFTGYLEGTDLATAYASSFLLLFPSTTETFGNVILEAYACGIPVLVSDQGASAENVIPEKTGFIVPQNNPHTYASFINQLLANQPLHQTMSKNCLEFAKSKEYEDLLLQMIEKISLDQLRVHNTDQALVQAV
ncbi:MAG: glycosyltransferase [Desulfonauticus sp.]|nr:glycosyltransferase [Desulfonauticus sp.]